MENDILYKETIIEKELIQLLWSLDIDASVKTDKKSLPYKETFKTILYRTKSYSDSFYWKKIYIEFVKEILNKGYRKIRFYCELIPTTNSITTTTDDSLVIIDKPNYKCSIKYYIHY